MDKVIATIAAEGIPACVLKIALNTTKLHGGARLTRALSSIGPGGMIGGLLSLGVIQATAYCLTKEAIERIYMNAIRQMYEDGISHEEIMSTIDEYRISPELRDRLKSEAVYCSTSY